MSAPAQEHVKRSVFDYSGGLETPVNLKTTANLCSSDNQTKII
jgi:hypothetical protein